MTGQIAVRPSSPSSCVGLIAVFHGPRRRRPPPSARMGLEGGRGTEDRLSGPRPPPPHGRARHVRACGPGPRWQPSPPPVAPPACPSRRFGDGTAATEEEEQRSGQPRPPAHRLAAVVEATSPAPTATRPSGHHRGPGPAWSTTSPPTPSHSRSRPPSEPAPSSATAAAAATATATATATRTLRLPASLGPRSYHPEATHQPGRGPHHVGARRMEGRPDRTPPVPLLERLPLDGERGRRRRAGSRRGLRLT